MTPKFISTIFALTTATALVPCVAFAEHFDAESTVRAATIFVQGARVTREAKLTLPAGQHQVTFFDIPAEFGSFETESLQTLVSGAVLGPVSVELARVDELDMLSGVQELPEYKAYKVQESKLDAARQQLIAIGLEATAAKDSLQFITNLEAPEGAISADVAAFSRMVRAQSLEARLAEQNANVRSAQAAKAIEVLEKDYAAAELALSKFVTTSEQRLRITLDLTLDAPRDVAVHFKYLTPNVGWAPAYDAKLDTVESTLTLERSLMAAQSTGEAWVDVNLSFSTEMLGQEVASDEVYELVRRISDPVQLRQSDVSFSSAAKTGLNDGISMMASPAMVEEAAVVRNYGLSQTYDYPHPVTLFASDEVATDLALDPILLIPDLTVRAVPLYNEVGYLVSALTNDNGEALLQGPAKLFRDGVYIGTHQLSTVVDGEDFEMPFGRIDGIKVSRVTLDRNEGDRGFISKSNEASSSVRLDVENLTGRTWPIEVMDRVSVSEQEDLAVDWKATPMPSEQGVDDRRGVLSWRFDLPAGESKSIQLDENLRWPEGQILR